MSKAIAVNDLVVFGHFDGSTMFRVKERNGRVLGIIDATIEGTHPNQRIQYADISCVERPNRKQMAEFIANSEAKGE